MNLVTGFKQARNYTPASGRTVSLCCLHTMEAPEKPGTAKAVCSWFAGSTAPQASAHFNVDSTEIWQSVLEKDVAWAAPNANRQGIHIEHAGYAAQSLADWSDPYSETMLHLSAKLVADICTRHGLPVMFVPAAGILAGHTGITTHAEVTKAYKTVGGHTDPGPNFPMAHYLNLVIEAGAPKEVQPMYSPALDLEPIVADLACPAGGAWLLAASGAIYAFGGAPYLGSPLGMSYFAGRTAAQLKLVDGKYAVLATSGESYGPGF